MVQLTVLNRNGTIGPIKGHGYDKDREFYVVKVDVYAGDKYRLNIGYLADLNDNLAGLYRSTYKRLAEIIFPKIIKYSLKVR